MQPARKAAPSSSPRHRQVGGSEPTRTLLPHAVCADPLTTTRAALELYDRIEVWVNEGGAGGEANQ